MSAPSPDRNAVLDAIRRCADTLGHVPSRAEFKARSGLAEYHVLNHFPSWREAVRIAGLEPHATNVRLDDVVLLADWGALVRIDPPDTNTLPLQARGQVQPRRLRIALWSLVHDPGCLQAL